MASLLDRWINTHHYTGFSDFSWQSKCFREKFKVSDRGTLKHSDLCKLAGKPNSQPAQEVKTWHCRIANNPKTLSTHAAFHTSRSRDAWDNLNIYCEQGIQEWEGGCSGEERTRTWIKYLQSVWYAHHQKSDDNVTTCNVPLTKHLQVQAKETSQSKIYIKDIMIHITHFARLALYLFPCCQTFSHVLKCCYSNPSLQMKHTKLTTSELM